MHMSIHMSIYMPMHMSIHMPMHVSIHMPMHMGIQMWIGALGFLTVGLKWPLGWLEARRNFSHPEGSTVMHTCAIDMCDNMCVDMCVDMRADS